jgi:hypothetical protein
MVMPGIEQQRAVAARFLLSSVADLVESKPK